MTGLLEKLSPSIAMRTKWSGETAVLGSLAHGGDVCHTASLPERQASPGADAGWAGDVGEHVTAGGGKSGARSWVQQGWVGGWVDAGAQRQAWKLAWLDCCAYQTCPFSSGQSQRRLHEPHRETGHSIRAVQRHPSRDNEPRPAAGAALLLRIGEAQRQRGRTSVQRARIPVTIT